MPHFVHLQASLVSPYILGHLFLFTSRTYENTLTCRILEVTISALRHFLGLKLAICPQHEMKKKKVIVHAAPAARNGLVTAGVLKTTNLIPKKVGILSKTYIKTNVIILRVQQASDALTEPQDFFLYLSVTFKVIT